MNDSAGQRRTLQLVQSAGIGLSMALWGLLIAACTVAVLATTLQWQMEPAARTTQFMRLAGVDARIAHLQAAHGTDAAEPPARLRAGSVADVRGEMRDNRLWIVAPYDTQRHLEIGPYPLPLLRPSAATGRAVLLALLTATLLGGLPGLALWRRVQRSLSLIGALGTTVPPAIPVGSGPFRPVEQALNALRNEIEERRTQARRAVEEVQQARTTAESAAAEARRATQVKDTFLANMSHELRTPLNAIIGYSEMLLEAEGDEETRDALGRILRSGRHQLALVDDLLDLAKIERQHVAIRSESVELRALLEDVAASVRMHPDAKRVAVLLDAPAVTVRSDRQKVHQILLNLTTNAVKFTPAGGRVTLIAQPANDHVQMVVQDTGIGIPAERLHEVFEPFKQAHDRQQTEQRGTGLGLSLSRALARALGGDLTVRSRVGRGSAFTLRLPRVD